MKTTPRLIDEVAHLLGVPRKDVCVITNAFINLVRQTLIEGEEVRLDLLGTLYLKAARGKKKEAMMQGNFKKGVGTRKMTIHPKYKFFVYFRKSVIMKRELIERHGKAPVT